MGIFGEGFIKVRPDVSGFKEESENKVTSSLKTVAKAAAGAVAIGGAADFLKDAIGNAVTFQEQMVGLDKTLDNVGQGTDKAKRTADNYAEALSKVSGFARSDVAASLQKATQGTGNLGKAMKVETTAANLARARHIDLSQATLIVTKAFDGNTSSLKRLGIGFKPVTTAQDALNLKITAAKKVIDDTTGSTKKQAEQLVKTLSAQKAGAKATDLASTGLKVQKKLIDLTAGGMKAFGNTTAGKLAQVRNEVDEVQTKIGLALLPTISKLASLGAKYIGELDEHWPEISKAVSDTVARIENDLAPVKKALLDLEGPIQDVIDYFGGGQSAIKDLGVAVVGFVVLTKTIAVATTIYEGLATAIFLARNAQIALDVAMEENPVGIVVTAIAALSLAVYEAYEHIATFRNGVNAAFGFLQTYVEPILKTVAGDIATFVADIRAHWSQITGIIGPIARAQFAALELIVTAPLDEVKAAINLFGDVIHGRWSNIWHDLVQLVVAPLDDVKSTVTTILANLGPLAESGAELVAAKIAAGIKTAPSKLEGLAGVLLAKLKDVISEVASDVIGEAEKIGTNVVHGIGQGIRNGAGDLAGVAKKVAKDALSKASFGALDLVQVGSDLVSQITAGTKKLGPALTASLISQITTATTAAKDNLTSLTGSLSTDIGTVIDAATARAVAKIPQTLSAAVAGFQPGASISDAQAKIAADNAAKQQRSLQTALDAANAAATAGPGTTGSTQDQLDQAAKDAQTDLDDFLLQAQIDSDTAAYNQKVQAAQDQGTIAKQSVQDQIALWTQQYNAGVLSQQDYLTDITNEINSYASGDGTDAYTNMGTLLGAAFETSFQTHLDSIKQQIQDIAQAGPAGLGGAGGGSSVTNPADAVSSQFVSAKGTVTGDQSALASAQAALKKAQAKDDALYTVGAAITAASKGQSGINALTNQQKAADTALKAAQKQVDAATTQEKKDALILAALQGILVKIGVDPNAVIAAAGR